MIYWTTIFGHRNGSGGYRIYTGVPGGYRNPPEVIGPHGPKWWKRRGGQEVARGPPCPNPNWEREAGAAPLLLPSLHLLLPPSPSWNRKGGQNLLGVGLPPLGAPPPLGRPSPPPPFIYGGGGHPIDTTFNLLDLLAVCGAPLHHSPPR